MILPFVETMAWAGVAPDPEERDIKAFEFPAVETRAVNLFTAGEAIEGIDLNRFRRYDLLDPVAVYNSGKRFAILEATWGLWVPPSFAEFWPRLLDAGFLLMGYGFFRGDQDGTAQAELLLETVRPMHEAQGFTMPLFPDVEPFSADTSTPRVRIQRWRAWVDTIRTQTRPGAYSNVPYWESMMLNEPLPEDCVGWAAHYTPSSGWVAPVGWKRANTPLHQYGVAPTHSWCPAVPGMKSVVDVNRFYGSLDQLRALGGASEDPMSDPVLLARIVALEERVTILEGGTPPPPPPVDDSIFVRVTRDPKAVAQYSRADNPAGNPIMEPYPHGGTTDQRITFATGTLVKVAPIKVQGDGARFWRITERKGRAGETLYLKDGDVTKA